MTAVVADFDRFCLREHPRLVASLALYTGARDLAVELSQEALARACRDWAHVSTLDAPGAWAHRVAINLVNSHFRRRKFERAALARAAARGTDDVAPPDAPLADGVSRCSRHRSSGGSGSTSVIYAKRSRCGPRRRRWSS